MKFELMALPFAEDALEPHISARTISYHYGKHHRGYLTKLEAALKDDPRASQSLEEIVAGAEGGLFNLAAQVWNHDFYWNSLDPSGKSRPSDALATLIDSHFGDIDGLKEQLKATAAGQFGSGWAWLVYSAESNTLAITSTSDAELPDSSLGVPLLTVDVWEHAYYLDHQNDRPGYLQAILDNLLNWDFASANLEQARG
ncbi:MAG: superoxide dismutase [Pseudomonadales bacterium]